MSQSDTSPVPPSSNDSQTLDPRKRSLKTALICFVLGLMGGGVTGLVMNETIHFFPVIEPPGLENSQGIYTAEQIQQVEDAHLRADYRNIPLNAGLLGLAVTACLGLAPGLLRRLPSASVTGLFVGGISGVVAGAGGGVLAVVLREQLQGWQLLTFEGELHPLKVQLHTMAIQFPVWVGTATALAITFAVSFNNGRRLFLPILGAAVAGWLVSSLLYPTAASILFTSNNPDMIIPDGFANRLFWGTFTAGLMGIVVGHRCDAAGPETSLEN